MQLLSELTRHMNALCSAKTPLPQSVERAMLVDPAHAEAHLASDRTSSPRLNQPCPPPHSWPRGPACPPVPLLDGIGVPSKSQWQCHLEPSVDSSNNNKDNFSAVRSASSKELDAVAQGQTCNSDGESEGRASVTHSSSPRASSGRNTTTFMNTVFEPRPTWNKQSPRGYWIPGAQRSEVFSRAALRLSQQGGHLPITSITESADEQEHVRSLHRSSSFLGHCIISPSSPYRLFWDVIGGFFIFWDLLIIPLRVFDPPVTLFTVAMDWMTLLYWTANMLATFLFGYVDNGVSVLEPRKIAIRYFKLWFWIDLGILLPDWIMTVVVVVGSGTSSSGGATSSVRLLRILRLARTLRLLRLVKLQWVVQTLDEQLDSEYASILANLAKMITLLLATNHFVACAWFVVADAQSDDTVTWLSHNDLKDSDWYHQYSLAFHWSITQFTPASVDVGPKNLAERVFAITVVVFALVGFSYLVGSITGSLTQLRSMKEEAAKQFWSLRRYLRQNQVPFDLTVRIQKYLQHAWQKRKRSGQCNLQIIELLSEQLQSELHSAIYVPHLLVHPLFNYLSLDANVTCNRLAAKAISRKALAQNDQLFITGEVAHFMYFIRTGRLRYLKVRDDGSNHSEIVDQNEDWISEPALWTTQWIHLGSLSALTECELLVVHPELFSEVVHRTPQLSDFVTNYAQNFLQWVNGLTHDRLSDICQGEIHSEMIAGFVGQLNEAAKHTLKAKPRRGSFRNLSMGAVMQRGSTGASLVHKLLKVAPG